MNVVLWSARVCVILITLLGVYVLDRQNNQAFLERQRLSVTQDLSLLRARLDGSISENIQTVRGLVAAIATEPGMDQRRFAEIASVVMENRAELRNIGAAPDLVMRLMYPMEGNEAAVGLDFRANAAQWPKVRQAAENGRLVLAGPVDLVQGGQAFIGRIPVFVSDPDGLGRTLWGLISAVIDMEALYRVAGISDTPGLQVALRTLTSSGRPDALLYGRPDTFQQKPVVLDVPVAGGMWQLAAIPEAGWPIHADNVVAFRGMLLVAASLILLPGLWLTISLQRERVSQRQLQALFSSSPMGMALFDRRSGDLVRRNSALDALAGYGRGDAQLQNKAQLRNIAQILTPPDAALWQALRAGQRFGPLESSCLCQDGGTVPVLLAGTLVKEAPGRTLVWVVLQDITEQKRVERIKGEFVSTVSHELRTPLTSISGALKLVSEGMVGELPEKARDMVSIAQKNSDRLTLLINDLLDMDKLISGRMAFNICSLPLAALMKTALNNIAGYAHDHDVTVDYDNRVGSLTVKADEFRFLQVMDNLLSNAIKFSPGGSIVRVSAQVHNDHIRITVCDEGPGIPEEFRGQVFENFAQADGSDRRARGGTGLGLAITRGLLDQMDGAIHFEPGADGGTCFYITLPRGE